MNSRYAQYGILLLRLGFGIGLATYGYSKLFEGRLEGFAGHLAGMGLPLPHLLAWTAALVEFIGGIALALGIGGPLPAALIATNMAMATFVAYAHQTFQQRNLPAAYLFVALALLLTGNGRFSVDRIFRGRD